jgi:hypothetical protein
VQGGPRVDFTAMAVRREIPALRLPRTVAGFLKVVELCKGLVVLPCLTSLVEVYGKSRSLDKWATSAECKTGISAVLTVMSGSDPHMSNLWNSIQFVICIALWFIINLIYYYFGLVFTYI